MRVKAATIAFGLIACGTAIEIAGTDMVLPAIPSLPASLGGSAEQAQLVLAAFTAGAALGLLVFGELGARHDQRALLLASLVAYAAASYACTWSDGLETLIALRFVQGATGSAAAVFAPGMLRAIYGEQNAVRALGALGSIEALAPALAPLLGIWLLHLWGWQASFDTIAVVALVLAAGVVWRRDVLPACRTSPPAGTYGSLLRNRAFVGHALGYALTLAGLLVFVFGAPTVFTRNLGKDVGAFILLQLCGIVLFVVAANLAGRLVARFDLWRVIRAGSALSSASAITMLAYTWAGGTNIAAVILIFAGMNIGLGLRGAPGFHAAIAAAQGDDARASALVVLSILLLTASATAVVAPFITIGLPALGLGAALLNCAGLIALAAVPKGAARG